ncbi:MAG: hypothetical protein KGI97_04010 [Alphaproteobacteria bacterium]|nr:hypothetical protein [Alphaproteobacteria bacterium]
MGDYNNQYLIPDANGKTALADAGTFPSFCERSTGSSLTEGAVAADRSSASGHMSMNGVKSDYNTRAKAALDSLRPEEPKPGEISAAERERLMGEKMSLESGYNTNFTDPAARVREINQKLGLGANHRYYAGKF